MGYKLDFPFTLQQEEYEKYLAVIDDLDLGNDPILTEEDLTYMKLKVVGLKFKTYEV